MYPLSIASLIVEIPVRSVYISKRAYLATAPQSQIKEEWAFWRSARMNA